jgi:cellulose biosynthesis protein BcsQ
MQIISVQSLAGGTGVTHHVLDLAREAVRNRASLLLIDTTTETDLAKRVKEADFPRIGGMRNLFEDAGRWSQMILPVLKVAMISFAEEALHLPVDRISSPKPEWLKVIPGAEGKLRANLFELSAYYDQIIIDVENGNRGLMQLFSAVSDEIHFIERADMKATADRWRKNVTAMNRRPCRAKVTVHGDMQPALIARYARLDVWNQIVI